MSECNSWGGKPLGRSTARAEQESVGPLSGGANVKRDLSLSRDEELKGHTSFVARSVGASWLHESTALTQTGRPAAATAPVDPFGGEARSDDGEAVLFEGVLPVSVHLHQRDEVTRSLGLCVKTTHDGSAEKPARTVLVRLTDPHDPFLLFQMHLPRRDYEKLSEKLELRVDFNGFPAYVVGLLEGILHGESAFQTDFTVQPENGDVGVFRIVEPTPCKTVEHIALTLIREGDAGQKRFLAEQFQHFQRAFLRCSAERTQEGERMQALIDKLSTANSKMEEELFQAREEMKAATNASEKELLTKLQTMQDSHRAESDRLRESHERRLKEEQQKASEVQDRLREDIRRKDNTIGQLREKIAQMELGEAALRAQLRTAEDKLALQSDELAQLRGTVEQLREYKTDSSAAMKENEINYVSVTERLKGALCGLRAREEELVSLRDDNRKQDRYIHRLSEQNERLTRQMETAEANLAKTHHIIANQLESIKSAKERYAAASSQLRSQQQLLSERDASLRRAKDDLAELTQRVQSLTVKNSSLREQLQQTEDARELLSQELKNSQTALLHLQRSTSVNGRHWGVFGTVGSASGSSHALATGGLSAYSSAYSGNRQGPTTRVGEGREHAANNLSPGHLPIQKPRAASPEASPSPFVDPSARELRSTEQAVGKSVSQTRSSAGLSSAATIATTTTAPSASVNRGSSSPQEQLFSGEPKASDRDNYAVKSFFSPAGATTASTRASAYF